MRRQIAVGEGMREMIEKRKKRKRNERRENEIRKRRYIILIGSLNG